MAPADGTPGQGSPRKIDVQRLWGQDQGAYSFQLPGLPPGEGKTADFQATTKQNLTAAILAHQDGHFRAGASLQPAKIRVRHPGRVFRTHLGLSTGWKDPGRVCPDSQGLLEDD